MILQVSYRWSPYHPWDVCKQPCKEWNISTANRKTGEFTILAIQQNFVWSPIKRGLVFMGQSYWMILPRGENTPSKAEKTLRFRSPGGAILGSFFFWWQIFGGQKTNAAESCCFCFLSSFLLMKIECLTVLMNHWSFNNSCPPFFLILIYETFCHTKQDFRHIFSESLGLSQGPSF